MNPSFRNPLLVFQKFESIPNLLRVPESVPNIFVTTPSRIEFYKGVIIFTIFFPYIPSIIPSSDTQPILILVTMFLVVDEFLNKRIITNITGFQSGVLFMVLAIYIHLVLSITYNMMAGNGLSVTKPIAFTQFLLAAILGFSSKPLIKEKHIQTVLLVYAIFSVIYFLTRGMVEDILIRSRGAGAEALIQSGRGARTLSSEPSAFATQILNILVLQIILFEKSVRELSLKTIGLASFCLLASFSGYGFVIFVALFGVRFPKLSIVGLIGAIFIVPVALNHITAIQSIRFVTLLKVGLNQGVMKILDLALGGRISSFLASIQSFLDNFWTGDGFTNRLMGGFIGLPASLGLAGFAFVVALFWKILFSEALSFFDKVLLTFWFLVILLSGNIAIPIVGVIVGLMFRRKSKVRFA